jgi:integrase
MKQLVTLWKRPSHDGKRFRYYLIYIDEDGKRRQKSLGHTDARKAERQRAQFERELRMGIVEPASMKLSEFIQDSLDRTGKQIRENTRREYAFAMKHFIRVVGNIDFLSVQHRHGEKFLRACLDSGNSPATGAKKIRHLKRLFRLAVDRGQSEVNPLARVRPPRVSKRKVHVFTDDECTRLVKTACRSNIGHPLRWDLLLVTALCTGMRRGELINATWRDIDFQRKTIDVSPKKDTDYVWEWHIKDTDRRTLPLIKEVVDLLAQHQADQPDGYPYVFVPPFRYDHIQKLRAKGKWSVRKGNYPLNNFDRQFRSIRRKAGIEKGAFHDLRRTCLSNWFANGLRELDVMQMAGHSKFETTRNFYLVIRDDILDRARRASKRGMRQISVANLLQTPSEQENKKRPPTQGVDSQQVKKHARQDSNLRPTD